MHQQWWVSPNQSSSWNFQHTFASLFCADTHLRDQRDQGCDWHMAMRDGEECLVRVDDGATPDASLAQPQGSVLHHWTVIAHICSSFSRQLCRTKGLVASPMQAEISQAFFFLFSFFLFNEIKLFGDSENFSGFCLFLCMSFYQFFFLFSSSSETAKGLPELMFCVQPSAVETLVSGGRRLWRRKKCTHIKSMPGADHWKGLQGSKCCWLK